MKIKPIIIVAGEPYGVFLEIFFKTLNNKKIKTYKTPILIIASYDLLLKQLFEGSEDEIKYATTYLNGVYDGVLTSEWVTEFGIGKEAVKICIKHGEYPSIIEVIFMMQDYRADKKNWDRLDNSKIEERLDKLKKLLERGLLTPEEATIKRKEILNSL